MSGDPFEPRRAGDAPVAIVGSGVVATAVAWALARWGIPSRLYERGPRLDWPFEGAWEARMHRDPAAWPPGRPDLARVLQEGDYPRALASEVDAVEGGGAVRWEALTPRLPPEDFATATRRGFGRDWPLGYEELEPWYGDAEAFLAVSGTDADNPFAPPRSRPYPLPPFELSWDDRLLAERLAARGLALHTTPQARTRAAFDGRAPCVNFGTCAVCPIGARYAPQHHLRRLEAQGWIRIHHDTVVRRVLVDRHGRARGLVVRSVGEDGGDREVGARRVVVAAGALATARLLLLSPTPGRPDGPGNGGGRVGRDLLFHRLWLGRLRFREALHPGRVGVWTGASHQFLDPPGRGRHGGARLELPSRRAAATHEPVQIWEPPGRLLDRARDARDLLEDLEDALHWRPITVHAEAVPDPETRLELDPEARDRFGDPLPRVHHRFTRFDRETHRWARRLVRRIRDASGAEGVEFAGAGEAYSGYHHLGGCAFGASQDDGVVDGLGRVHGARRLWLAGGAVFPGSGTVNPTLTMVALALRSAAALAESLGNDSPGEPPPPETGRG